jgi:hypothetical protein
MPDGLKNPRYIELIQQFTPAYSDPQSIGVGQIRATLVACCVIAEAMDGIAESVRGLTKVLESLDGGGEG